MLPAITSKTGATKKVGFVNTQHGLAMYSATQIRDSKLNGEYRGFLIMLQLLEQPFVQ